MTMVILLMPNPLWVRTLNHFIYFHFDFLAQFLYYMLKKLCYMFSFVGTKFCLQLVMLVVRRLCDNICKSKMEKVMFAIRILISR
jgi:hypothetical protein